MQTKRLLYLKASRGYYYVNEKGEIARRDMPFAVSGQWLMKGLMRVSRQSFHMDFQFEDLTPERLKDIELLYANGKPRYRVVDFDHGTLRAWGDGVEALYWMDVPVEELEREKIVV